MTPRDDAAVRAAMAVPFGGYSRRPLWMWAPDQQRIVASVAVLAAMLLSGVLLGSPRSANALSR